MTAGVGACCTKRGVHIRAPALFLLLLAERRSWNPCASPTSSCACARFMGVAADVAIRAVILRTKYSIF